MGGANAYPICKSLAKAAIKYPKKVAAKHSNIIKDKNVMKCKKDGLN